MSTMSGPPLRQWLGVAVLVYFAVIGAFYAVVLAATSPDRWLGAAVLAGLGISAAMAVGAIATGRRGGLGLGMWVAAASVAIFAAFSLAQGTNPVSAYNVMNYGLAAAGLIALWSS
jgi:hypothetical protein